MIEITSTTEQETFAVGRRLAGLLKPGDVVLLSGKLGCGKTLFTSGIGDGLGVDEPVVSPSFVLVRSYRGFLPLIHADVYRLSSTGEFEDLDLLSAAADGVLVIEWGGVVAQALPEDFLTVEFDVKDDGQRLLSIRPSGSWRDRDLGQLAA